MPAIISFILVLFYYLLPSLSYAKLQAQQRTREMVQTDTTGTRQTRSTQEISTLRNSIREVQGTVKSTTGTPIRGATVQIVVDRDTLRTSTNQHGVFVIPQVPSAEFLLMIRGMGYEHFVRRYFMNDSRARLQIPEIILAIRSELLEEIDVTRTPGPVVKGDTTEYWAEDYIVRSFVRLKDLLEQMEGITIDEEGSVFHNGIRVVKALFNNVEYFSGSIRQAINELPAEIVQRIQIIDQTIEPERRTATRPDSISKVLNVVTKRDKSAGHMSKLLSEAGEQKRYRIGASFKRIDGAEQSAVSASHSNLIPGIRAARIPGSIGSAFESIGARNSAPSAAGGTYQFSTLDLQHNINFGNHTLKPIYTFNSNALELQQENVGESYFPEGTLYTTQIGSSIQRNNLHKLYLRLMRRQAAEMEGKMSLGQADGFGLRLKPKRLNVLDLNLTLMHDRNNSQQITWEDRRGIIESNELRNVNGDILQSSATLNLISVYKLWNKSISSEVRSKFFTRNGQQTEQTALFANEFTSPWWGRQLPSGAEWLHADQQILQERRLDNGEWQISWTNRISHGDLRKSWGEIEYNLQYVHRANEEQVWTSKDGEALIHDPSFDMYQHISSLRVPLHYKFKLPLTKNAKINLQLLAENEWRSGKWKSDHSGVRRYDFALQPRLDLDFLAKFKKYYGQFLLSIYTIKQTPDLKAFNPDTLYLTPFLAQIGNPHLRPTRNSNLHLNYKYLQTRKGLQIDFSSTGTWFQRDLGINRETFLDPNAEFITEISQYLNVTGGYRLANQLNLSQRIAKTKSVLSFDAQFNQQEKPYFANGQKEKSRNLTQVYNVKYSLNSSTWLRVRPSLQYVSKDYWTTLQRGPRPNNFDRRLDIQAVFSILLPSYLTLNIEATQSVTRMTNLRTPQQPFVANMNVERRFLKDKSLILSAVLMDIAKQNYLTNSGFNEFGYSHSLSNPNSRFALLQLSWQPEVWTKSRFDKGQVRRGDGSLVTP